MPLSAQHKKKKSKNYATLFLLLFLCGVFFAMSIIKFGAL